jgi:hypothetical protein
MRNALLVSALVGGAVSLVAVLSTRAHSSSPGSPRATPDDPSGPSYGQTAGAEIAPNDPLPAPAWVAERPIDGPPVSLTASDGSGLTLAAMRASAVVEGPLAFTEIKLAFDNPENRVREGTFKIVLPQGASLGRFAMKINDAWQEGEVVPKERARVAYEDALHRKQDPALMERGAGNEFTARVFPIPARGRKEIIVSYGQELVGGTPYALPLRGLPELGTLDISVGGEGITPQHVHNEKVVPSADFVMEGGAKRSIGALRAGNLVVARVRPVEEALPDPVASAIVLVDTSASRALGLAAELRSVQALLEGLAARHDADIAVTVAAFDQEVVPIYRGTAKGFGQAEMDRIAQRRALGASNVEKALGWAKDEAKQSGARRVVLVTDAVPTAGEEDGAKLAKAATALRDGGAERIDVVAVGGLRDDALARKLVTAGLAHDGVVVAAADGAANMVRRLEAGTKSDVAVAVEGASWSYPKTLNGVQPGDEVLVYAELAEGAPLRVKVGGGDVRALDATPTERPLVERAWAQAKVASLEAEERDQGKSLELEKKIIAISTGHRVLSEYTALLVLETDADYARFQIDRRALADILTVDGDRLAWVKRTDLPSAFASNDDKRKGGFKSEPPPHMLAARDPLQNDSNGTAPAASAPPADGEVGQAKMDTLGAGGLGLSGVGEGAGGAGFGSGHGRLGGGHSLGGSHAAARPSTPSYPEGVVRPGPGGPSAISGYTDSPPVVANEASNGGTGTRARGEEGAMGNPNAVAPAGGDLHEMALGSVGSLAAAATAAATPPPAPAARMAAPASPVEQSAPLVSHMAVGGSASLGGAVVGHAYNGMQGSEPNGVDPFTGKFKLVKDRLARGDQTGALAIASQWQASEPGDVLALVSLGEASEAKGDVSTAGRAYGSIIDLFPSRADLRRFAGERLEHVKAKDAGDLAIDTFDKARRDRPDHPASHRLAAFARVRRGEYAAAFDILVAGLAQRYPAGRFAGVDQILREDLGLVAAAWMKAEPGKKDDILARLRSAGGSVEDGPSIRFVLNWETDANDVDFHIHDAQGGHAFYAARHLPSGGDLYADVTTGYGPECFTVRLPKSQRATPYTLQAHYYSRGPMGYGMGKLEIIDHDGHGGLKFEEREFVVMVDQAFVDLGTVK